MEMTESDGDSENIYMNTEDTAKNVNESEVYESIYPNTAAQKGGSEGRQRCCGNPAVVCLGLLCVLLLAVIMGLSIKHNTERQKLQSSYTNMTMERDQLQSSYTNMTMERDSLLDANSRLTLERNKLQISFQILSNEKDALLCQQNACPLGWRVFMSSCYYVSNIKSTWDQSRQDCIGKGADLVIINSQDEQRFISGLGSPFWIGLTDHQQEGFWKWVDDTPLSSRYWRRGEPNNVNLVEHCAQVSPHVNPSDTLFSWNDIPCNQELSWICEKIYHCMT